MTCLVTGGTGFAGAYLVRQLLLSGESKVVVFDLSPYKGRFKDLTDRVEFIRGDVGDQTDVNRVISKYKPRTIYHLGAMLAPLCDNAPAAGIRANAIGTFNILEAAHLFGVEQVVFASTIAILSASESADVLDDFAMTRPNTVYGAAKLFSENLGHAYERLHGIDFRALRLPVVVGPGTLSRGYAEYFNKAIEESLHGRPYTIYVTPQTRMPVAYVKDVARAFVQLANAPKDSIKTGSYIVFGPIPPTAQELCDAIKKRIHTAQIDFQVNPAIQKLFDTALNKPIQDSFARNEWGWAHQYDLEMMVEDFMLELKE